MDTTTFSQSICPVTKEEAEHLIKRLSRSSFLLNRGIVLSSEPSSDPCLCSDGTTLPGVSLKIEAPTEAAAAMGYGFVVAIYEGVDRVRG